MMPRTTTWRAIAAPAFVLGRDGSPVLIDQVIQGATVCVVRTGELFWHVDADALIVTLEPTEPEALTALLIGFPGAEVIT